jgi:tetratricopeptide (TPR) repeat protein
MAARALALVERAYGEDGAVVAQTVSAYASVLAWAGDHEAAVRQYQRADRLFRELGGDTGHERAVVLVNLASILSDLRRGEEALAVLDTAAPLVRDGDRAAASLVRAARVEALRLEGRLDAAWAELQALSNDPDAQLLEINRLEMRRVEGELLLDLGRVEAAATVLRGALDELESGAAGVPQAVVEAHLRFALARALANTDRVQARALAGEARQTYAGIGSPNVTRVDAWLEAQAP